MIAAVAEKPLELEDIYRKLNVEKAGYISECIQDLIEAGFLARHYTWTVKTGGPAKRSLIRIIDNGLVLSHVEANWFKFAIGTLLILAVVANAWLRRTSKRIKLEM